MVRQRNDGLSGQRGRGGPGLIHKVEEFCHVRLRPITVSKLAQAETGFHHLKNRSCIAHRMRYKVLPGIR